MEKNYVLGVDYGTDSCRVILVDTRCGEILATHVALYPRWAKGMYCDPAANRYRQHPLDYIESLEEAVKGALAKVDPEAALNIKGIGFDTTGSTPVLTDSEGIPLALLPEFAEEPDAMFVLWKDHTSIAEADEINNLAHRWPTDYTSYSGGTYSSEWVWAKALHILRTNSTVAGKAYSWVEHCDWMTGVLTGNTKPETILRSRCAAGHKAMWNAQWGGLPAAEFLSELDPRLASMRSGLYTHTSTCDVSAGNITSEWASRLGLRNDVVISVGGIDAHIGAVGAGIRPGTLVRIMGTSTCDIIVAPYQQVDRLIEGICGQVDGSVTPGAIGMEAGQSAFGDIYAWFQELLAWPMRKLLPTTPERQKAINEILSALTSEAELIAPSETAPVALDWWNGRRTPYADQSLKGAVLGLTLGTTAPALFRTLVESTAFGSRAIIEHFWENGVHIDEIIAIGGISLKSPFVMQTLADVIGIAIKVSASEQACALGSAMFAAVAAGLHPNIYSAQDSMSAGFKTEYTPIETNTKIYESLFQKYLRFSTLSENV